MNIMYQFFIVLLFLLLLPLGLVIAFAIVLLSGFPILHLQRRVGKNGKSFVIYKFRSMLLGADRLQKKFARQNEAEGPVFKIHDDPRLTLVGSFLSHTGLDELPQLYNVLRGEMALIGPRPFPIDEEKKLKPWMREREKVLPGIISPAILSGKYHEDFDAWMKSDVIYTKTKSTSIDVSLGLRALNYLWSLFVKSCVEVLRAH